MLSNYLRFVFFLCAILALSAAIYLKECKVSWVEQELRANESLKAERGKQPKTPE